MSTHCTSSIAFHQEGRRRIEAAFDAGRVSSDGGVLLLREVAVALGLFEQLADCFEDRRDPRRVEHSVEEPLDQRVLGLACGYEDLNDQTPCAATHYAQSPSARPTPSATAGRVTGTTARRWRATPHSIEWSAELATPEGRESRRTRVAFDHALARLSSIQVNRARYRGLEKVQFHTMCSAVVANLHVLNGLLEEAA